MSERLNPKSILICNLALRECKGEVLNDAKSLMNHFIKKNGWKTIPELAERECKNPKDRKDRIASYLVEPEQWWFDNQFSWKDIRNLHFLHKTSKRLRSLRMYYHE